MTVGHFKQSRRSSVYICLFHTEIQTQPTKFMKEIHSLIEIYLLRIDLMTGKKMEYPWLT